MVLLLVRKLTVRRGGGFPSKLLHPAPLNPVSRLPGWSFPRGLQLPVDRSAMLWPACDVKLRPQFFAPVVVCVVSPVSAGGGEHVELAIQARRALDIFGVPVDRLLHL